MTYRVRITQRAEADIDAEFAWIAEHEGRPLVALSWLDGVQAAFASLREYPLRCPRAPEAALFDRDVHHILVHRHRLIFIVQAQDVVVLHVRHGSRLAAIDLANDED